MSRNSNERLSLGDFQTPSVLAERICRLLAARGVRPASILEPSSGLGNILLSAIDTFAGFESAIGIEIQPEYARVATERVHSAGYSDRVRVAVGDFFEQRLDHLASSMSEPILVIGNPPWATSARLGSLGSQNLPQKRNIKALSGLDAVTGRANFDIAEWFILQLASAFSRKRSTIALLCKTSVARLALSHLWATPASPSGAACFRIDAKREFAASTDACLLVLSFDGYRSTSNTCDVFASLESTAPESTFGLVGKRLVADVRALNRHRELLGSKRTVWRSGIKHDCSAVMELTRSGEEYRNGFGELASIERDYVYPLVKATQLFHRMVASTDRAVIVPQRCVGEETRSIEHLAPRTWSYLLKHASLLDSRKSSIYRGKPRFSVFGIGAYSFSDWKVCISALHKELRFSVLGPIEGRPVMLDDTAYFLSVDSEAAARSIQRLLESSEACDFLNSLVFWDSKRPITTDVLGALDLAALAATKGIANPLVSSLSAVDTLRFEGQTDMFDAQAT